MQTEVTVAVNFVISYLYNKLPRRRVHMFGEEMDKAFKTRFAGHWYPDQPLKGTAYRCVRVSGDQADAIVFDAAKEVGLDVQEIFTYLPEDLTLWIDPNEVSYRIGEKGQVKMLFSEKSNGESSVESSNGCSSYTEFNPDAKVFMPSHSDGLLQAFNQMTLQSFTPANPISNGQVTNNNYAQEINNYMAMTKSQSNPNFISAAEFAQTKFGSTKLRTHTKRPSRLNSGQDFRNYQNGSSKKQQRYPNIGHLQQQNLNRSLSLSPGNIPFDWQLPQQTQVFQPQNYLSINVPGDYSNTSSQQTSPIRSENSYPTQPSTNQNALLLAK